MQNAHRFRGKLSLVTFYILFLCIVSVTSTGSLDAFAKSNVKNPLVAVAKDETTSTCFIKKARSKSALSTASQQPCPAGTEVGIVFIPLSEALAHHETYILLPTQNASSKTRMQTYEKMKQLMNNKRNELFLKDRVKSAVNLTPSASCAGSSYLFAWDYSYNSTIEYEIGYNVASNCTTLTLISANVTGISLKNSFEWYEGAYAGWVERWGPPDCRIITNADSTYWPRSNYIQPTGYYFVWDMSVGTSCITNIVYSFSVGPLT